MPNVPGNINVPNVNVGDDDYADIVPDFKVPDDVADIVPDFHPPKVDVPNINPPKVNVPKAGGGGRGRR